MTLFVNCWNVCAGASSHPSCLLSQRMPQTRHSPGCDKSRLQNGQIKSFGFGVVRVVTLGRATNGFWFWLDIGSTLLLFLFG